MADEKVQLIIEAFDQTKEAFKGLEKNLRGLETDTRNTSRNLGGMFKELKEHWLGLSAAAYAAYKTISKGIEFMKLGAMADQAEESFNRLSTASGVNSAKLISDLQRASAGTIDTSNIMQKAMQAMAMGIEDPAKRLPKIMEMSRIAARTMGTDTETAFDTLTVAIAGGVRAMGPLVRAGLVTKEEFKLINKAIELGIDDIDIYSLALAHHTKLQAQFGDVSVNTTEKFQKLSSAWKEGAEILGQQLTKAIYWFTDKYLKLLEIIAHGESFWATIFHLDKTELNRTLKEIEDFRKEWIKEPESGAKLKPGAVSAADKEIEALKKKIKAMIEAAKAAKNVGKAGEEKEVNKEAVELFKKAAEARKWLADQNNQIALSEYDYQRAVLLNEYELRAESLGWTEELYNVFLGKLKIIDDKEIENNKNKLRQIRDLELQHELAVIDLKEKTFQISEKEAVQERIDNYNQYLESLNEDYKLTIGVKEKDEERLQILSKIDDIQGKITDNLMLQKELTSTFVEGLGRGFKQYSIDLETPLQKGLAIAKEITQSMENAFMNFLDSTSEGFLKFGDLVKQILNDIMREMLRLMVVKPFVGWLTSGLGGILGMGGGTGQGILDLIPEGQHTGGVVGAGTRWIPEFHSGGLNSKERYVINKVGERYITEEQNTWLTKLGNAMAKNGGGESLNVSVGPFNIGRDDKKLISDLKSSVENTVIEVIRKHT